jgi:hypothetical protein
MTDWLLSGAGRHIQQQGAAGIILSGKLEFVEL